jgi:DnaJ homolog subfamily C member 8
MARKVFDELNRALKQISGEGEEDLERVFNYIRDARDYVFHLKGLAIPKKQPTEQDRQMLLSLTRTEQPSMGRLIQLEFTRAVRELHYRDRTRLLNEQGRELQESEIVATEGKRVRKLQKEWEDGREDRIGKWRVFAEKGVKKKKKKEPLLGAIRK